MPKACAGAARATCTAPASRAAMPRALPWFGLSAVVLLLDRLSKWAVLGHFAPGEMRALTSFFNLVLVFNKGAAFSFLASAPGWQTPVFAGFALIASAVIAYLLVKAPRKRIFCTGLALILGGAIGNLIDRLRFGQVVDFLDSTPCAGTGRRSTSPVRPSPSAP